MLERIKIRNFKSFAEAELRLRPLTVMIGANASGKTNFIEAIGLLAWMAGGQPLTHVHNAIRDGELQLRGAPQRLTRFGNEQPIGFDVDAVGLRLELDVALTGPKPGVEFERLHRLTGDTPLIYELPRGADKYRLPVGPIENEIGVDADRPLFVHALPEIIGGLHLRRLAVALARTLVFRPSPEAMRGYADSDDRLLRSDAANLSGVLWNVYEKHGDEILEFARMLPEQNIRAMDFIRVPGRSDVMVKLLESFGGQDNWQEAAVLSDGTLRALAIGTALFSGSRLLIIEDIDDGVHPSRVRGLLDLLRRHARDEDRRILVTTHNPALLDALADEELAHVVACYRDPEQGDSRLIELGDLHEFPALMAQGTLGELVTKGILDRALKHDRTPEQRAAEALEWLANLEAGR